MFFLDVNLLEGIVWYSLSYYVGAAMYVGIREMEVKFRVTYSKTLVDGWIDLVTLMVYFVMDRGYFVHWMLGFFSKNSMISSLANMDRC